MPMQSVTLRPGVDIEQTPALNEVGISQSQLIRTKNGMTQTVGGWQQFGVNTIPSTVRDLHAWQDTRNTKYLGVGALTNLVALTETSYTEITPQTRQSSSAPPNVSISSGSNVVTVSEPNSGLTFWDAVFFKTPVSVGNILLEGSYIVNTVISTGTFTVVSSVIASTTITSSGMLPVFSTTQDSARVVVTQPNHTEAAILGVQQNFLIPTSVGGLTILGNYNVSSVADSTNYTIDVTAAASATTVGTMNNGNAQYLYYITPGPVIGGGLGFGGGPYGIGGYGVGSTVAVPSTPGTPITVTDWTLDNWGEVFIACEENGPVFTWSSASGGATNARLLNEGPLFNGGAFVSMPQQILVTWATVQTQGNGGFNPGGTQDPLLVRWSDAQDYTNWEVSDETIAGSFHIPTGSVIRGGLQAPNYGIIWTDLDVWIMQFLGNNPVAAFNFTRAGSGCGLVGKHAAGVLAGDCFWCGEQNFFALTGQGVMSLPCSVWDFVFQGRNTAQDTKICCAPNSIFNEVTWYFCYGTATENNAYVKYNIVEGTWDYGFTTRTAWQDVSVWGAPIGVDTGSTVYQHEKGNMISGAANTSFRSGWWAIADGEDFSFVDFVMPDFIWGTYGDNSASINIKFYSTDYPGDTPRSYGPYTVTQANQYITPRIRGRLMAIEIISATNDVFWRLGRIRYRWAPAGRR